LEFNVPFQHKYGYIRDEQACRRGAMSCQWMLAFLFNFNGRNAQDGSTASPCQISSKSVKPGLRYGDFSIFQDGGRPPSWICYVHVRTTHEEHLVVFIAVRKMVEIDAVVLIICLFFDLTSLA